MRPQTPSNGKASRARSSCWNARPCNREASGRQVWGRKVLGRWQAPGMTGPGTLGQPFRLASPSAWLALPLGGLQFLNLFQQIARRQIAPDVVAGLRDDGRGAPHADALSQGIF